MVEEKETKDGQDSKAEKEAKGVNKNEERLHRSVIYIGDKPVKLEEEKETRDAKDRNDEKEAKGEVELEDEQEKAKRERDRIHAELLSKPPHGSEIYIYGMPLSATEEELKEFCKSVGEVAEVTIVRKEVCATAFVSFRTVDMASKAIRELNKSEFKGNHVRCTMSNTKNTIFIGNIPSQWGESDLKNAVDQVGPGVICVLVMTDTLTRQPKRFGYVAYYNNACAYYSQKNMSKADFKLGTNSPTIRWAEDRVKEVFVKNLPKNVTVKQIKELFERHGDIENVVLPRSKQGRQKGYAFVHFKDCANAMKALKNTERHELNGAMLNCSLARSQRDKKPQTGAIMQRGPPVLMPSYSSQSGYGSVPPAHLVLERNVARPLLYAETTSQGLIWHMVDPTTPSVPASLVTVWSRPTSTSQQENIPASLVTVWSRSTSTSQQENSIDRPSFQLLTNGLQGDSSRREMLLRSVLPCATTELPGVYFSGLLPLLNLLPPCRTRLPVVSSNVVLSLLGQENPSRFRQASNMIRDIYPEITEQELQVLQPEIREMLSYWRQSNRNAIMRDANSHQMLGRSLWDMIQEWRETDRYESLRLDVDNMSYEDLVELGEKIGVINAGVEEEFVNKNMRHTPALASLEDAKCCICQEEYENQEQLGTLDCGHDFHAKCIKIWLGKSNLCPICKQPGLKTWQFDDN